MAKWAIGSFWINDGWKIAHACEKTNKSDHFLTLYLKH